MTFTRRILNLLSFVLPVAMWTGSTSYESAKFLVWALAAAAWVAMFGVTIARRRSLTPPPQGVLLAGLAQLLVMLPGLWHAHAPLLVARAVIWTVLWWLTAWVTMSALRDWRDLAKLLWCAGAGAALVSCYALLQKARLLPGPGEWDVPAGIGTLGNENYVAEFAAIWLFPSILLVVLQRSRARRLAALTLPLVLAGMLAFTAAAAARVSAISAMGLVLAGETMRRSRWHRRVPVLFCVVAVAGLVTIGLTLGRVLAPGYDPVLARSFPARVFADNHGDIRRTDWLVARRQWEVAPLLGVGAGNYGVDWLEERAALTRSKSATGLAVGAPVATRAHNEYLQAAAELGWLGLIWLLAVLVAGGLAWGRMWRSHADRDTRLALLLGAAGLATAALQALVSFPTHLPASGLALALLTGILCSPVLTRASAGKPRPPLPRWAALPPLAVAVALVVGALRAFHGDLLVADGSRNFTAGDPASAVAPLRAGIARLPWPGTARLYLGQSLAATGKGDEALDVLAASLHDRPSFEAPLAMAELHIDGRRYEQATAMIDLVEDCRPAAAVRQQAGYLRALMALKRERWEEARVRFHGLTTEDAQDHRSWLGFGYLHALQGDRAAAAACYRRAIATLEEKIAAPAPNTSAARGQVAFWKAHLATAHQALDSVTR